MMVNGLTVQQRISEKRRRAFLAALRTNPNVTFACKAAGFSPDVAYYHRKNNPEFAAWWDQAIMEGTDHLLEEARRRAVTGVVEDVFYQGQVVGQKINYSDTLLMFLIKGLRPEFATERRELSGDLSINLVNYVDVDVNLNGDNG